MSKNTDKNKPEMTIEAMMQECQKDRYKIAYASVRWARELKLKENLAEPVQLIIPRAIRDVLTGKVTFKEIEKLAPIVKVAPPPVPAAPTLTLTPPEPPPDFEEAKKKKGLDDEEEDAESDEDAEEPAE